MKSKRRSGRWKHRNIWLLLSGERGRGVKGGCSSRSRFCFAWIETLGDRGIEVDVIRWAKRGRLELGKRPVFVGLEYFGVECAAVLGLRFCRQGVGVDVGRRAKKESRGRGKGVAWWDLSMGGWSGLLRFD